MSAMSKETRRLMIEAIIDYSPPKGRGKRRRELKRGSDTLVLLEYREWVDRNVIPSLFAAEDALGELTPEEKKRYARLAKEQ